MRTKISIILPNYNSSKTIVKTVNSVFKQTYRNWELIIVDDNSDYKTKKILSRIKSNKIKIYYLNKNHGAGYCRNLAIKKSTSKYLAFIDSDDIWEKNKLKEQINFMKKNKYNFSYTFYQTVKNKKKRKIFTPLKYNFNNFIVNTSIATSSMIVKKYNDKKIKFTNSTSCDDYYFKCALLKKYNNAYCYPKFLTKYYIRNDSVQSNRLKNLYWVWYINKKYNKLSILKNINSIFNISINSFKKYGFR